MLKKPRLFRLLNFLYIYLSFFHKKSKKNLRLYVDYQKFRNLFIENLYYLLFISKFFDKLDYINQFI